VTRASLREYAAVQRERYLRAPRVEKHRLLTEVVAVTGLHRKAAIRLLRRPLRPATRRPRSGRPRRYGPAVAAAAQRLSEVSIVKGETSAQAANPAARTFRIPGRDRLVACLHREPEILGNDPQLGRGHGEPVLGRSADLPARAASHNLLRSIPGDDAPIQLAPEHLADRRWSPAALARRRHGLGREPGRDRPHAGPVRIPAKDPLKCAAVGAWLAPGEFRPAGTLPRTP
jgi:hypothetical protein